MILSSSSWLDLAAAPMSKVQWRNTFFAVNFPYLSLHAFFFHDYNPCSLRNLLHITTRLTMIQTFSITSIHTPPDLQVTLIITTQR